MKPEPPRKYKPLWASQIASDQELNSVLDGLMTDFVIFGVSVALSFAAWGAICYRYVWPFIRSRSLPDAAAPLLYVNVFRFVGASFLVPGVAGSLPRHFAVAGAFGDILAVVLAWVALMLLRKRAGYAALWIFNLWGAGDLLFAFHQGLFDANFLPSALGATFYIPTVYVPLLMCVHLILFALLLRAGSTSATAPSAVGGAGPASMKRFLMPVA